MKTMEADVIVVAAGLAAAITAGENDLKAIVFEKSNTTGGAANMGMGPLGIGTKYQKKAFCDITVDEALNKHMEYTHYRVDSDLVQTYFNKSASSGWRIWVLSSQAHSVTSESLRQHGIL